MSEEEQKKYYEIVTAAWKFFRIHSQMDGSEEAYRLMHEEGKRQAGEFLTDEQFAKDLFVAMSAAIQRYETERRGKRDGDQGSVPG